MDGFTPVADDIKRVAGAYIPRVRREEGLISRMPQGMIALHTDTPFVIDVRKDPPFNDHDFVYRIDSNTGKCATFIDGEQVPIESIKNTFKRVYGLFNVLEDVCNGQDLSRRFASKLMDERSDTLHIIGEN